MKTLQRSWTIHQWATQITATGMSAVHSAQPPITVNFAFSEDEQANVVTGANVPANTWLSQISEYDMDLFSAAMTNVIGEGGSGCDPNAVPAMSAGNWAIRNVGRR